MQLICYWSALFIYKYMCIYLYVCKYIYYHWTQRLQVRLQIFSPPMLPRGARKRTPKFYQLERIKEGRDKLTTNRNNTASMTEILRIGSSISSCPLIQMMTSETFWDTTVTSPTDIVYLWSRTIPSFLTWSYRRSI